MSHRKNAYGKRGGRRLAVAGFFVPFLVAAIAWLIASGESLAQIAAPDATNLLQQVQRGGLGPGITTNGVIDTTGQLPQNQTLLPQTTTAAMRQPPSRLEQILSARAGVRLMQFGYDQLGVGRQVMVPETGAVADDYIMGPGDEVVVALRGQ